MSFLQLPAWFLKTCHRQAPLSFTPSRAGVPLRLGGRTAWPAPPWLVPLGKRLGGPHPRPRLCPGVSVRVVGKEGKRACTQPSQAGQPCWNGKGPQRREEPLVGTSKLLFSTVEKGQTVILIFQATSSAKLAFPSSCWDGKLHRPVLPSPPPPLC